MMNVRFCKKHWKHVMTEQAWEKEKKKKTEKRRSLEEKRDSEEVKKRKLITILIQRFSKICGAISPKLADYKWISFSAVHSCLSFNLDLSTSAISFQFFNLTNAFFAIVGCSTAHNGQFESINARAHSPSPYQPHSLCIELAHWIPPFEVLIFRYFASAFVYLLALVVDLSALFGCYCYQFAYLYAHSPHKCLYKMNFLIRARNCVTW